MAYEFMFGTAMDIIQKKKEAGEFISSDDTVCVIYSRSGKIYTGSSRTGNYMDPLCRLSMIQLSRLLCLSISILTVLFFHALTV